LITTDNKVSKHYFNNLTILLVYFTPELKQSVVDKVIDLPVAAFARVGSLF